MATSTNKPAATILDLDEIMDMKMDSVETLPDFITPPPGIYLLEVRSAEVEKYENKEKQKAWRFRITYAIKETLEISNDEQPYPNGSLFSESFMGTEDGIKYFKKASMNILGVTDFDGALLGEVREGLKGAEFKAKITIRKNKGEGGAVYENINVRAANPVVAQE